METFLIEKLQAIQKKFNELSYKLSDIINNPIYDQEKYIIISKKYKKLEKIMEVYQNYKNKKKLIYEADKILSSKSEDLEIKEIAKSEKNDALIALSNIEKQIKHLLSPKLSKDDNNVILELRSGTGGDEACIFVEDIFRMYTMYFKYMGWIIEILNLQKSAIKGYKEVILGVYGNGVYGTLKFESGVHRVQRIPKTESKGRIHTSTVTVVVLPEIKKIDFEINPTEIKRDTFRSSGAGGQHVNKTESAVRLTHIPSGIVAECQDQRSQHKNLEKAMTILYSRVYQMQLNKKITERSNERKCLINTGERSYKIRTYNYIQDRVTDHRINKSIYNLESFMNGNIKEMIDAIKIAYNSEKL
ncbi:MAG: peptide chain release factor 1 [Candidatus Bostrichicola ureolyticus]|nr:MAG: peptide chain release factor 1 [Candidatus Bostrichicola ureolyticus]